MISRHTSVNIDWGNFDIDQHRHEHCSKKTVYNPCMQPKFKSKKQILKHKAKKCLDSYQQVGDWHLIENDSVIVAVPGGHKAKGLPKASKQQIGVW